MKIKVCKSYLNLGTGFQGLCYDSMIAHTTIAMLALWVNYFSLLMMSFMTYNFEMPY